MPLHAPADLAASSPSLLDRLGAVCAGRDLADLAGRLAALETWIRADLASLEADLARVSRGRNLVQKSAHHLLDLGGKRLRPMCVALAAKVGGGFGAAARELAVAVELVHSATLLHDDVVDLGDTRRGAPTARRLYGNAASVFAGDWLLVEALRHIRRAGVPGQLDFMLTTIEEMILAEAIQLENRGRINASLEDYLRIVEGKTAALFRWAMHAGARAGGLDEPACAALGRYGLHLGVAFQAIDDLLDLDGDPALTGKALLADLCEGKMTYPLIIALARDRRVMPILEDCAEPRRDGIPAAVVRDLRNALAATGALEACRRMAHRRTEEAIAALAAIGDGAGKAALITVAEATVQRRA